MKRLFIIYGLRRSGIHAVVNWIAAHLPGTTIHYDSIRCVSRFQVEKSNGVFYYVDGKLSDSPGTPSNGILVTEDVELKRALSMPKNPQFPKIFGEWDEIVPIFLFRVYENFIASRWHRVQTSSKNLCCPWRGRKLYAQYWNYAHENKCFYITYDYWFRKKSYRRSIERQLGLPLGVDGDMDIIPHQGRGSSFDGQSVPGTKMNVLDRASQVDGIPPELMERPI